MITNALLSSIRQIVSPEYVITDETLCEAHGADDSGISNRPGVVIAPASETELAAVFSALSSASLPVSIRGTGTGVVGGAVPDKDAVVISTARLRTPVHISEEDATVTAGAGIRILEVQRAATAKGFRFAGPLPVPQLGSIGGLVARNGNCFLGPIHRHIKGLRAVLPTGEIVGHTPEIPGLNDHFSRLLPGSEGSLGVITEVTFSLQARNRTERIILASFENPAEAAGIGAELIKAGVSPLLADVVDKASWTRHAPWPAEDSYSGILLVWLTGVEANIEDETSWTGDVCEDHLKTSFRILSESDRRTILPAWTSVLHSSCPGTQQIPLDLSVPAMVMPDFLAAMYEQTRKARIPLHGLVRMASNTVSMHIPVTPKETELYQRAERLAHRITRQAEDIGGSGLVLHGAGVKRIAELKGLHRETDLRVMRSLKKICDPGNMLHIDTAPPSAQEIPRDDEHRQRLEPSIQEVQRAVAEQIRMCLQSGEHTQTFPESWLVLAQIIRMARADGANIAVDELPVTRLLDVHLCRMQNLTDFNPDDRTITVEGGVTPAQLHAETMPAGLWCPCFAHAPQNASISTILAWERPTAAGALSEEVVTGINAVTGHGELIAWGGFSTTGHAGLRLPEICIGTRNRYAVITAAVLKLSPMPIVWGCMRIDVIHAEPDAAFSCAETILRETRASRTCATESIWVHIHPPASSSQCQISIIAEFEGKKAAVDKQISCLCQIAEEAGAAQVDSGYENDIVDIWGEALSLHEPWHITGFCRDLHLVVWASRSELLNLSHDIHQTVCEQDTPCRILADPTRGRIDVLIINPTSEAGIITSLGGYILRAQATLEVWSGDMAGTWIGKDSPAFERVRTDLKTTFDPDNVLPDGWGELFSQNDDRSG